MDDDYNDVDYESTDGGRFKKAAIKAGVAILGAVATGLLKGIAAVISGRDEEGD